MKKHLRFSIRKKVFLLTAALSVALIVVSVTIASVVFSGNVKSDAEALCKNSAEVLSEYLETYDIVIAGNGSMTPVLSYYLAKLEPVYRENREEIETMSNKAVESEQDFAEKKKFFTELTSHIFANGGGFGMSYDLLSFKNAYVEIIEEMERLASVDGVLYCSAYFYDAEHGNLVSLYESTSETHWAHMFPGGVVTAPDSFVTEVYEKDQSAVLSEEGDFASFAPVRLEGKTVAYVSFSYSIDIMLSTQRGFLWTLIWIMLIATAVILILYLILADRWLVKSVRNLSASVRTFTSHMENEEIQPVRAEIHTNDEIMDLSDDFFALQNKVIVYSEDIARKSAEEEHMRAELNIASRIQMQSLPNKTLHTEDAFLSSFIKPAKEVGGDLFDYFVTDGGQLFFVIADVSGKGVPAALFMMRGKEIIRSCAKAGMNAGRIAETANRELCKNNQEGLFITAFIGIYDSREKKLSFARAGHEQPFLLRDGKAEKIGEESNIVLGIYDNIPFEEDCLSIREGDRILLYTDGLNEGINEENEEFGYERIREVLENADGDLLESLYEEELAFAGQAEQFDDITMLLFECVKNQVFTLQSPVYGDIPDVTDRINAFLEGYDSDKTAELDVIIDEIMNNVISYAFPNVKKPKLDIEVRLMNGVAQLTFSDNGVLFNPLTIESPDVELDMLDRPEGGMGILISKTIADRITYRVSDGRNRLTVVKDLKTDENDATQ